MQSWLPLWAQILLIVIFFIALLYLGFSMWKSNKDLEERNKAIRNAEKHVKQAYGGAENVKALFDKNGHLVYFCIDGRLEDAGKALGEKAALIKEIDSKNQ